MLHLSASHSLSIFRNYDKDPQIFGVGSFLFFAYFVGMLFCGICYVVICFVFRIKVGENEIVENRSMFDRVEMQYHPQWLLIAIITVIGSVVLGLFFSNIWSNNKQIKQNVLDDIQAGYIPGYKYNLKQSKPY